MDDKRLKIYQIVAQEKYLICKFNLRYMLCYKFQKTVTNQNYNINQKLCFVIMNRKKNLWELCRQQTCNGSQENVGLKGIDIL